MVELNDLDDVDNLDRCIDAIITYDETWRDKFDALKSHLKIPFFLFGASLVFLTAVWLNQKPKEDEPKDNPVNYVCSSVEKKNTKLSSMKVNSYQTVLLYKDDSSFVKNKLSRYKESQDESKQNITLDVTDLFDIKQYSMSKKTNMIYRNILAVYQEIYPPFKNHEKADLFNKIDSNQDTVISELEAKVCLDKLNQELYLLKRY